MKEKDRNSNVWISIGIGFVTAAAVTAGLIYYKRVLCTDPRRREIDSLIREAERLLRMGKRGNIAINNDGE